MKEKVEKALESIRPSLQADGGDIHLIDVEEDVVKVKLTGACSGCAMSAMTMSFGVEAAIKEMVPEVKKVILV